MSHNTARMRELQETIDRSRQELIELQKATTKEVRDYTFQAAGGRQVKLSELFNDSGDLIVAHNMGKSCPYCTLWADNYNGVVDHLESRSGFVVVSRDDPATQEAFAKERGWRFKLLSAQGDTFIEDMGYRDGKSDLPGVSTFRRDADGVMRRVATAPFGPGDNFCSVFHFFDLLADGVGDWAPKYRY